MVDLQVVTTDGNQTNLGTGKVSPDAPHEHIVLTGTVPGHRIGAVGGIVNGIDSKALHWGEVNDDTAVTQSVARNIMAAAPDRDQKIVSAGEINGVDNIGDSGALGNKSGTLVNHAVPDDTSIVIASVVRP